MEKKILHFQIPMDSMRTFGSKHLAEVISGFQKKFSDRYDIIVSPFFLQSNAPILNLTIDASTDIGELVKKLNLIAEDDMVEVTAQILEMNTPTRNGRIYVRDEIANDDMLTKHPYEFHRKYMPPDIYDRLTYKGTKDDFDQDAAFDEYWIDIISILEVRHLGVGGMQVVLSNHICHNILSDMKNKDINPHSINSILIRNDGDIGYKFKKRNICFHKVGLSPEEFERITGEEIEDDPS